MNKGFFSTYFFDAIGIITRIFEGRRSKVKEMLSIASTADRKCQMDVALRYYSWAETLMRSLPSPRCRGDRRGEKQTRDNPERAECGVRPAGHLRQRDCGVDIHLRREACQKH